MFTPLFSNWKDDKGKIPSVSSLKHIFIGRQTFFYQHWKCLQKRLLILIYSTCNKLETSSSTLESKYWPKTFTYSIEWNAVRKVCKLIWKKKLLEYKQIFPLIFSSGRVQFLSLYHTVFTCHFVKLAIEDIMSLSVICIKPASNEMRETAQYEPIF